MYVNMWIWTLTIVTTSFSSLSFSTLVSVHCGPVWDSFTANNIKALEKIWLVKLGCRRSVHMDILQEKHHWLTLEQQRKKSLLNTFYSSTPSTNSRKDSSTLRQSTVPQPLATQKETLDTAQSLNRWPPKKKHPTYLWTLDIPMTSSMTSNLELQTFPSASFQHWPVQELLYCLYNCQTGATSVMTKWEPPHPRLQMTDHHPKHRLNFNSQVHIPFPLHLHLKLGPAT